MIFVNLGTPASHTCPQCRHHPILNYGNGMRELDGRWNGVAARIPEAAGVLCPKCGWTKQDLRSVRYEFTCKCGRYMGPIYLVETRKLGKYVCFTCAGKRRSAGLHPNPKVNVRYEIWCDGRCGSLQGYLDFPETTSPEYAEGRRHDYFCNACAKKPVGQELFRHRIVIPEFAR